VPHTIAIEDQPMIKKEVIELFRAEPGKKFKLKDHLPGWKQSDELE